MPQGIEDKEKTNSVSLRWAREEWQYVGSLRQTHGAMCLRAQSRDSIAVEQQQKEIKDPRTSQDVVGQSVSNRHRGILASGQKTT